MKIGQCEICKSFQPIPETWSKLMLCSECNYQITQKHGIYGTKVVAIPMPTTLAEPVTLKFNPKKPRPRARPKAMA